MSAQGFDFTGKRVLVTGASHGIGYGVAEAFAAAGADLTILADDDEGTAAAAARLTEAHGRTVTGLPCDITDAAAVQAVAEEIGALDVLVNNAGLERITPITDPDPAVAETFRRIIDINVVGSWQVTRAMLPHLSAGACIVFTASVWSRTAVADFSAYCASKHATLGLMRSLAQELAPRGIRVNAVCPGWVKTEASLRSLSAMAAREGRPEQALLDEITGAQAFGGLMEPADVAGAYLYLASPAAANVTGQAVNVDRGEVMS